jgi:hypothetical protein
MSRSKKDRTTKRKTTARKQAKTSKSLKPQAPKTSASSAAKSRAGGIRLFNLAGRPTKEQFQLVYGNERGHLMTWKERAKAGVSAKQFQAALAAKQAGR